MELWIIRTSSRNNMPSNEFFSKMCIFLDICTETITGIPLAFHRYNNAFFLELTFCMFLLNIAFVILMFKVGPALNSFTVKLHFRRITVNTRAENLSVELLCRIASTKQITLKGTDTCSLFIYYTPLRFYMHALCIRLLLCA